MSAGRRGNGGRRSGKRAKKGASKPPATVSPPSPSATPSPAPAATALPPDSTRRIAVIGLAVAVLGLVPSFLALGWSVVEWYFDQGASKLDRELEAQDLADEAQDWLGGAGGEQVVGAQKVSLPANDADLRRFVVAKRKAEKALKLDPRSTSAMLILDSYFRVMNDYLTAAEWVEEALVIEPSNALIWNRLAVVRFALKQDEKSLEAAERAIALDPDFGLAHNNAAGSLITLNRNAEAEVAARRAVELLPENGHVHNTLGIALLSVGRVAEGRRHLSIAAQLGDDSAQGNLERCLPSDAVCRE